MTSTESRIATEEQNINQINEEIRQLEQQVTKPYLESILSKQLQFHEQKQEKQSSYNDDSDSDLQNLSITQLNNKSELIHQQIQEFDKLSQIKTKLEEIEQLISNLQLSINSLLDLQHLSHLFKQVQEAPSLNYMIYKQIIRKVASLHVQYVDMLNAYLKLVIPNEFTILHASVISDFNQFIIKNGYNLNVYANYKMKWDKMIDSSFSNNHEIAIVKYDVDDEEEMEIRETEGTDFITSLINFVKFINKIHHTPIKNYLNSKISKLVAGQLFKNVEEIIHDEKQITKLNELMKLCEETNWNFLNKIEGSGTIEERLNKLHLEWITDDYVGKIKHVLNTSSFSELKDADEYNLVKKSPEETLNKDETDWDESWDDKWDEDEEQEEDETQLKDPIELNQLDEPSKQDKIKISQVPEQLEQLFTQFSKYSNNIGYLVTTIKALALVLYPSLTNSFIMYNDFVNLSQITGDKSLTTFMNSNWNQIMLEFIQELKTLISTLNLEAEVNMEDEILDDYNLNQLSLIYKWFQDLTETKQFRETNFKKFQQFIIELVDFANNWLLQLIFTIDDISENQCTLYNLLIENLNNITIPILGEIGVSKNSIDSFNKMNNVRFLLNNHLKDIMDRFYQGELFDLSTDEMVNLIKSIFIQSEVRDTYLNEIIEFRNMS